MGIDNKIQVRKIYAISDSILDAALRARTALAIERDMSVPLVEERDVLIWSSVARSSESEYILLLVTERIRASSTAD